MITNRRNLAFGSVLLLLLPTVAVAQSFTRGPAVRVNPNIRVEIRWIHDWPGDGRVDVFDNPNGSGPIIIDGGSETRGSDNLIAFNVGGTLRPDTTYYFKVTHHDPNNIRPDITSTPPLPSFFTGAQPPGANPQDPKLTASDGAPYDRFGTTVAISGDVLVSGAPSADSIQDAIGFREGAAYVFIKPPGGWATTATFSAKLTPSDGVGVARFGTAVAIDGDTIAVGAAHGENAKAAVYVFVKPASGWTGNLTETAKLIASDPVPMFGTSVAIEGEAVVVGAPWADNFRGAVFVFERPAGGWIGTSTETARLSASDGEAGSSFHRGDFFGHSLAINGDTVAIGAPHAGRIGSSTRGAAYIFVKPAGGWPDNSTETARLTNSDGRTDEQVGSSVAIGGDTVVVGAMAGRFRHGSTYVFLKPANGWAGDLIESANLTASDGEDFDFFGFSAAISGDVVLIGAVGDEDMRGAAYIFVKPTDGWAGNLNEVAKRLVFDGAAFDFFGSSIAVSGETVVVGAEEWRRSNSQGSAYAFSRIATPTDSTAPAITINAPAGAVYMLNQAMASDYVCSDQESGVASCVGPVASGQTFTTSSPGAKSFTVNASDQAGNAASATTNYQVQYQAAETLCNGAAGRQILAPIGADGTSVFKRKSTVSAKFRVCDANGVSVGTPGVVSSFGIMQVISGTVASDVNEAAASTTPNSAFRWDPTQQQWIINISTNDLRANATYVYRISLNDGTNIDFRFGLK
jgi:hypothetical protein